MKSESTYDFPTIKNEIEWEMGHLFKFAWDEMRFHDKFSPLLWLNNNIRNALGNRKIWNFWGKMNRDWNFSKKTKFCCIFSNPKHSIRFYILYFNLSPHSVFPIPLRSNDNEYLVHSLNFSRVTHFHSLNT